MFEIMVENSLSPLFIGVTSCNLMCQYIRFLFAYQELLDIS